MKQKKIVSLLTILSVLIISQALFAQEQGSSKKSSNTSSAGMVYQCEKDFSVISNNSGSCNKCGSQLKALTMDEAMDNLSGKSKSKPELKVTSVYSLKKEEPEKLESAEVAESVSGTAGVLDEEESGHNHSAEHQKDVMMTDLNRDGYVYQCPNCPAEMSDKSDDCEECYTLYELVTVDAAKKNIPTCDH
jgi:hypothetical protein